MKIIGKANLVEYYNELSVYGVIHGAQLPSLDEFLTIASNSESDAPKSFDDESDKLLEAHAFRLLNERQKACGQ